MKNRTKPSKPLFMWLFSLALL